MTFTIATAADKVNIWDSLNISQESPQVPSAPAYTLPISGTPLWTCWTGNFEILAALFPRSIHLIHRKDYITDVIETGPGNSALAMGYKSSKLLYYASDKVVKMYDVQNKKEVNSLTGQSAKIKTLSVSNDDQRIASGAVDGSVMVHSLKHGTKSKLNSPFKQAINQVAFYYFKKSQLIAGGDEGHISLWDLNINLDPQFVKKDVHLGPITGLAYAPCNKQLYCSVGLDKSLVFHDVLQSKKSVLSFTADQGLTSVSMNDDHCAAVGTLDGRVLFYDIRWKGSILSLDLHTKSPLSCVSFQPPQWAIETFKDSTPTLSRDTNLGQSRMQPMSGVPNNKPESSNIMGIFSPVNKKVVEMKSNDLRKASLLNKMLALKKETESVTSPLASDLAETAVLKSETLKISENLPDQEEREEKPAEPRSDFQYQVLKNIIQDSLESFSLDLKQDIQNMHIELLRQFQTQKNELKALFSEYLPSSEVMEELERLKEENLRLKFKNIH